MGEEQLKEKSLKFRLEIVPRPGVLTPPHPASPQYSLILRSILNEMANGRKGQQLQGIVDFGGGEKGGLFLPFISCVPFGKSLNHSEPQFPPLK